MKNFIEKNWVFISGLISAIVVVLQQFTNGDPVDIKVVGYAVLMAVVAYVASQWKNQGLTALGIIGTLAATFGAVYTGGHIDWNQLIIQTLIALGLAATGKPQPIETKPE